MRHVVVFGEGRWRVDREMERVSVDPRPFAWIRSDEESAGEQGRCEHVGGRSLGELGPIDVRRGRGSRPPFEADPGPDRQPGVEGGILLLRSGCAPRTPPRRMVPAGLGEARSPAAMLLGVVRRVLDRPHDVRDAQDLRGLGGAGEGQEGGRCGGSHGDRYVWFGTECRVEGGLVAGVESSGGGAGGGGSRRVPIGDRTPPRRQRRWWHSRCQEPRRLSARADRGSARVALAGFGLRAVESACAGRGGSQRVLRTPARGRRRGERVRTPSRTGS